MSGIRQSQLDASVNVRRFLLEASRMRRKIDLHGAQLKRVVRQIKLEKVALLRNPKRRRFLHLNPESRRQRRRMTAFFDEEDCSKLKPPPNSKTLMRRTTRYDQHEPIDDGYEYGIMVWLRCEEEDENEKAGYHDNEETLIINHRVAVKFMFRLRNGLFVQLKSMPWEVPFTFTTKCATSYNTSSNNLVPIGLAALVTGLGIPDTCREAMFRDISSFAPPHPATSSCNEVTLCTEILITTLQREGEDVLDTRLRANVDRICRSQYLDLNILKNEANLGDLYMGLFEGKEEDCCSICLDELQGNLCEIPCSHVYHFDCIFKWMCEHNVCPLCRYPYQRLVHQQSLVQRPLYVHHRPLYEM